MSYLWTTQSQRYFDDSSIIIGNFKARMERRFSLNPSGNGLISKSCSSARDPQRDRIKSRIGACVLSALTELITSTAGGQDV